jgi:hypothetical protein
VKQQRRRRTEVVDDEATVGAPAGGSAEVGLAVGQPRGGEDVRGAVLDEVAGIGQRVPEVEQRVVLPLRPLRGRYSAGGRKSHHHYRRKNRGAPPSHRRRPLGSWITDGMKKEEAGGIEEG